MSAPVLDLLKTPSAILDYAIDWSAWLAGDTIATSTWAVHPDLTVQSTDASTTLATIWLGGGRLGVTYLVANTITTVVGRQETRTIQLRCEAR